MEGNNLTEELRKLTAENELLKKRVLQLETLITSSEIINSKFELHSVLNIIMSIVSQVMDSEASSILLMDKDRGQLYFFAAAGAKKEALNKVYLEKGEGIAGWVAEHSESVVVQDVSKDKRFTAKADKESGFVTKSILAVPMKIEDKLIGVAEAVNKKNGKEFTQDDIKLLSILTTNGALAVQKAQLFKDLNDLFLGSMRALSSAIDAKDPYTHGHSERVCDYALMIGDELGINNDEKTSLELAALLHDIGKIGVPERVLHKQGKLTEEEWVEMKKHPTIGADMLSSIKQLEKIIPGIRHHQERYDGQGYPSRLFGDTIPFYARIIAVADTFDAMTSNRPYRSKLPLTMAVKEIEMFRGSQFDPDCANAFIRGLTKRYDGKIPEDV
ncbi:MAG: HD domain-containing phosphohydrolase [Elusimicrobiota bacterium]